MGYIVINKLKTKNKNENGILYNNWRFTLSRMSNR